MGTNNDTTPNELVKLARGLLKADATGAAGVWPRAGALLARQALELALSELWSICGVEMDKVSARAQLLCFEAYIRDQQLGQDVRQTWSALSRATHHQPFELAPTAAELSRWFDVVERLILRITDAPTNPVDGRMDDARVGSHAPPGSVGAPGGMPGLDARGDAVM